MRHASLWREVTCGTKMTCRRRRQCVEKMGKSYLNQSAMYDICQNQCWHDRCLPLWSLSSLCGRFSPNRILNWISTTKLRSVAVCWSSFTVFVSFFFTEVKRATKDAINVVNETLIHKPTDAINHLSRLVNVCACVSGTRRIYRVRPFYTHHMHKSTKIYTSIWLCSAFVSSASAIRNSWYFFFFSLPTRSSLQSPHTTLYLPTTLFEVLRFLSVKTVFTVSRLFTTRNYSKHLKQNYFSILKSPALPEHFTITHKFPSFD